MESEPRRRYGPEMAERAREGTLARVLRSRAFFVLIAMTLLGWIAWSWLDLKAAITWAQELEGPIPALVLVPLQILVALSFSPLPSDVVGAGLCVVYGFLPGSLLVFTAWMLAAWIEYALVRRVVRLTDPETARQRLPRWLQRLPTEHPGFLICARWFPLGPHLVNGSAAAAGVPLGRFSWTAAVGIAPVALLVGAVTTGLLAAGSPTQPPQPTPEPPKPTEAAGVRPPSPTGLSRKSLVFSGFSPSFGARLDTARAPDPRPAGGFSTARSDLPAARSGGCAVDRKLSRTA